MSKQPIIREKCECCNKYSLTIGKRRLNTQYVDEESNFLKSCIKCYADAEEYYAERWAEYYSDCM